MNELAQPLIADPLPSDYDPLRGCPVAPCPAVPPADPLSKYPVTAAAIKNTVQDEPPAGTALVPAERKRHGSEVLDDAKRMAIVTMLAAGCSRRMAARYVECDPTTITRTAARDPVFAARLARRRRPAPT